MPKFDLAQLADRLGDRFDCIRELYLFGSRKFGTKSDRSDVDILVIANGNVRPQDLREFIRKNCSALDLFTVRDGRATSCQNESFIEANTQQELIQNLGATKFWTKSDGRIQADIDWTFTTRDDVVYTASALPNSSFLGYDDPSKLKIGQLLKSMTVGQFWAMLGAAFALLAVSFGIGYWAGGIADNSSDAKPTNDVNVTTDADIVE